MRLTQASEVPWTTLSPPLSSCLQVKIVFKVAGTLSRLTKYDVNSGTLCEIDPTNITGPLYADDDPFSNNPRARSFIRRHGSTFFRNGTIGEDTDCTSVSRKLVKTLTAQVETLQKENEALQVNITKLPEDIEPSHNKQGES